MYFIFEILGTIAFAMSGAMVAIEKKMDILGVIILGTTTAVGGGIVRDVLTGRTPPVSLSNPMFIGISVLVSVIVFLPIIRKRINLDNMFFVLIDAIGLGAFTVVGSDSVASLHNPFLQIFLGVVTGVGGGVIRDIFACEKPMIFVRHFYACASLAGAFVCTVMYPWNQQWAPIIGMIVIVILRLLAARFKWHLFKA